MKQHQPEEKTDYEKRCVNCRHGICPACKLGCHNNECKYMITPVKDCWDWLRDKEEPEEKKIKICWHKTHKELQDCDCLPVKPEEKKYKKTLKLLEVLKNISFWRVPTFKVMAKESGLYDNKSVIYSLRILIKKGLIDKKYKPIFKEKLEFDISGTSNDKYNDKYK